MPRRAVVVASDNLTWVGVGPKHRQVGRDAKSGTRVHPIAGKNSNKWTIITIIKYDYKEDLGPHVHVQ